jgi:prepilin-type N-terminal cleavage/methylation domain-containing protein
MRSTSINKTQTLDRAGFTVLEVLISIVLLAFIALGIYNTTTSTYKLRDTLANEADFYNGIRMAMGIFGRDIALLYTPLIMMPQATSAPTTVPGQPADAQDLQAIMGDQGRETLFWAPAVDKTGIRPSRFVGSENRISFIAVSHIRSYKESQESDFAKVIYELQPDHSEGAEPDTQVLVKIEDVNAFADVEPTSKEDKAVHTYPLLHGIKTLRFRYKRKDHDQWDTSYKTDLSPSLADPMIFPDIVEVALEVVGPSRLRFEGSYHFRPEIPYDAINPSF